MVLKTCFAAQLTQHRFDSSTQQQPAIARHDARQRAAQLHFHRVYTDRNCYGCLHRFTGGWRWPSVSPRRCPSNCSRVSRSGNIKSNRVGQLVLGRTSLVRVHRHRAARCHLHETHPGATSDLARMAAQHSCTHITVPRVLHSAVQWTLNAFMYASFTGSREYNSSYPQKRPGRALSRRPDGKLSRCSYLLPPVAHPSGVLL